MSYNTPRNCEKLGRVVFGEARGESSKGQLAVAYTVVNRIHHDAFPNSFDGVLYQRYDGGSQHHYNTLDMSSHDRAWEDAERQNNTEYRNAIKAAEDALSGRKSDPTGGAVFFASTDPNPATSGNQWHPVTSKTKVGNHWFACID